MQGFWSSNWKSKGPDVYAARKQQFPGGLYLRNLLRQTDHKYRFEAAAQHPSRGAAHHGIRKGAVAMRSHHDEVEILRVHLLQNLLHRISTFNQNFTCFKSLLGEVFPGVIAQLP